MKKAWAWIIVIPIAIGVVAGIYVTVIRGVEETSENSKIQTVFSSASSKYAKITKFDTFGTSLNIEGKIEGISRDNFEGAKILVTDGEDINETYNITSTIEDGDLYFSTEQINNSINLEEYDSGTYYVLVRVRLNNNKDYKYYLMENISGYENIEYYTLTDENGENRRIDINFDSLDYSGTTYNYLGLIVADSELPEDVYDIVIDPGHGGTDLGETYSGYNEASLVLDYGESLKLKLEEKGYKVKLTRDSSNSDTFTTDEYADSGRIGIACKTKAKYMISLHLNEVSTSSGLEVYTPNDCDLTLASNIAKKINSNVGINFSDYIGFKVDDGVYTKNYNNSMIADSIAASKNRSYEAYNLTTSTPYYYTIREVGGIATYAYVDGRNPNYSANKYYDSNQGIECYQIFLGYINNDLDYILNCEEQYIEAIADCF